MEDMLKVLLEHYAVSKGCRLSSSADAIIRGIVKKEGHCPCRLVRTPCPCPTHEIELQKDGHCHCHLFIR